MKKYTIKQWFSLLPPDIRERAIANTKKAMLRFLDSSFSEAIKGAFIWESSPEGHEYWQEISEKHWGKPE